jgi:hypothetical protein
MAKRYTGQELKARHAIASAKKEFGLSVLGNKIKYKIGTDDGGGYLEMFVETPEAAEELRPKVPMRFAGYRTCVSFYNIHEEEDKNFSYTDDE